MNFAPITQADFIEFLRLIPQIPVTALPDDSPIIPVAYQTAVALVSLKILRVSPLLYGQAVYNLGASNIFNWAPDVPGAPEVRINDNTTEPYFQALRTKWNLLSFVPGVIQETHDESTGQSMVVPDGLKNLTIADLQNLKDPFGTQYLAIAQRIGSLWGIS